MKNENKKILILSAISFSTSLKLLLDENENYIVQGNGVDFSLQGNIDNTMYEIFQYIFTNELQLPLTLNNDDDYYNAFIKLASSNVDKIDKENILKNGVVFDGVFSQDSELISATTLTLSMLDNIPSNASDIEEILNYNR